MVMGCCVSSMAPATSNRKPKGLAPSSAPEEIRVDADHRVIAKLLHGQPSNNLLLPPGTVSRTFGSQDTDFHDALARVGSMTEESLGDDFFSVLGDFPSSYSDASNRRSSKFIIDSPPLAETSTSYPRKGTRLTEEDRHKLVRLFRVPVLSTLHPTTDSGPRSLSSYDNPELAQPFPDRLHRTQFHGGDSIQPRNEIKLADFFRESYWNKEALPVYQKSCS